MVWSGPNKSESVIHVDNEWGIEVCGGGNEQSLTKESCDVHGSELDEPFLQPLSQGISFAYDQRKQQLDPDTNAEIEQSLEHLMSQLRSLK